MSVVHEDYDRAGADVIITHTFPTSRHVLEPAGLGDRFRESTTLAGELAKQAREHTMERQVHIADSISTFPPATTTRCSRRRYRHRPTKRSRRRQGWT
jgi:S-methylmethionine-dependent homocysteine/selenocysteine methylase